MNFSGSWIIVYNINGGNSNTLWCCNYHLGMLIRALELEWDVLSEEIGFWLPVEVNNEVHDDKPEGEEEPSKFS